MPKHGWVIQVDVQLKSWQEDLQKKSNEMKKAAIEENGDILKGLASSMNIKRPSGIGLSRNMYDNIKPPWLRDIWISGCQYYYDAIASINYVWTEKNDSNFGLASDLSKRCDASFEALSILRGYIINMVPQVILGTPASISDEHFLEEK